MGSAVREPRTPPRADTVGSLLRPAPLKLAVESFYAPGHSAVLAEERRKDRAELRDLEDRAIRDAVRRQIDIGLDVVTVIPSMDVPQLLLRRRRGIPH
jgi:methionine synthase II (cobalamin-independent)